MLCLLIAVFFISRTSVASNLTLLVQNVPNDLSKAVCIARNDAALFALYWSMESSTPIVSRYVDSYPRKVCKFGENTSCLWIQSRNWTQTSSMSILTPPALDYRWEDFTEFTSSGKSEFPDYIELNIAEFSFSVKASEDAYLLLCTGNEPKQSPCYIVVLGGWKNDNSALRKCTDYYTVNRNDYLSGTCGDNYDKQATPQILSTTEWRHFTVQLHQGVFNVWRVGDSRPILNWVDHNPTAFNYLLWRTRQKPGQWRFHIYDYLLSAGNNVQDNVVVADISTESPTLCFSFLYYKAADNNIHINVYNENGQEIFQKVLSNEISNDKPSWRLERNVVNLTETSSTKMRLYISASPRYSSGYILAGLDRFGTCNPDGDDRYISINISKQDKGKLTCGSTQREEASLKVYSAVQGSGECDAERYNGDCSPYCENIFHSDCNFVAFCDNIGCFCSKGYTGVVCGRVCPSGYGSGCNGVCGQCQLKEKCNHMTGICINGCEAGYIPPLCQEVYPVLNIAPVIREVHVRNVTFQFSLDYRGEGKLVQFRAEYKESEGHEEWTPGIPAEVTNATSYVGLIDGLSALTNYDLRVILITKNGNSYENDDVPSAPFMTMCTIASESDLSLTNVTSVNITLNWPVSLADGYCPERFYRLQICGGLSGCQNFDPDTVPYTIRDRKPYTPYKILLFNKISASRYNQVAMKDVTTGEAAPSAVYRLQAPNMTSSSIMLKWYPPDTENGVIRSYHISYKHKTYLSCEEEKFDQSSWGTLDTNETEVVLTSLIPYSEYDVSVSAFTVDYGPPAHRTYRTNEGETSENVIPEKAEESVTYLSSKAVTVDWKAPDCTQIRSHYKFRVVLQGTDPWAKNFQFNNTTELTSLFISNLTPFTNYITSVHLANQHGILIGNKALNIPFTTKEAEPPAVRKLDAYSHGDSWISLRWEPPLPPHGHLDRYIVTYFGKVQSHAVSVFQNSSCALWSSFVCLDIKDDLRAGDTYKIQVQARNLDVLKGGAILEASATTKESAPTPPIDLQVMSVSADQMSLTWKHPDLSHGNIRFFKVEAVPGKSGLKEAPTTLIREMKVEHDEPTYLYEVTGLDPSTYFTVTVYGQTTEKGEIAQVPTKTRVFFPEIIEVTVQNNTITNTSFSILLPAAHHWLTDESAYFVVISAVDTSDKVVTSNSTIFNEAIRSEVFKGVDLDNSYVAGEIEPGEKEELFTVGTDVVIEGRYGLFYNPPLNDGYRYKVTIITMNKFEDDIMFSRQVADKEVVLGNQPIIGGSPVGIVVGIIVIICIAAAIVGSVLYRKRQKQKKSCEEQCLTDMPTQQTIEPDVVPASDPSRITQILEEENVSLRGEQHEIARAPSQRLSCKIRINELEHYVETSLKSGELQRQHALFPRGQTKSWDYGKLPENKPKNRYGNLLAYDETRVKLKKLPSDPYSDYINANYIDGYKRPKAYIATQGPKPKTIVDFWRMAWQENIQIVVMLTNLVEGGKTKCEKYWGDLGQEVSHGNIKIVTTKSDVFADFTFKQMTLTCSGKKRKITHLHFTSWPDHGVPWYPQSVATFLKKLLVLPSGNVPILVHCSAGVGRTGTIILADACLRMAAEEGLVDILGLQQIMREQRANMVDNFEQYKLVHLVLLECLQGENSSIPCRDLMQRFADLKKRNSVTGCSELERQFLRLRDKCKRDQVLKVNSEWSKEKNRFQEIVPETHGRVYLSQVEDDPDSTYINAVYVDGFRMKNQFIATQIPLRGTVADFWRMILERESSLIVLLNEVDGSNPDIEKFWPSQGTSETIGNVNIENNSEVLLVDSVKTSFKLSSNEDPTKVQGVDMIHACGWKAKENLPMKENFLLEMWEETERLYTGKGPITVVCYDGATACGLFLAVGFVVEKLKLEHEADVFLAVRIIRQNRSQFVNNLEQYEFCHESAIAYLERFETYANFL